MSAEIGNWVRRLPDLGRKGTKWHLVESIVAGDAITRCGRRLADDIPGDTRIFAVSAVMPLTRMIGQPQLCKAGCEARETFAADFAGAVDANEDDGSTQPEMVP